MANVVSNTSPLQYLHQLGLLELLHSMSGQVFVPQAVVAELRVGRDSGIDVPDPTRIEWIQVKDPAAGPALRLVVDMGAGESAVLALALETHDAIVVLDDALARATAEHLGLPVIGTLGILVQAKMKGLVPAVRPLLDRLEALRFRVSAKTRESILKRAGEV